MMTEEARRIVQIILYGEEPLTYLELIFRPGFIQLMLTIWLPVIIFSIVLYIMYIFKKKYMSY